MVFLLAAVLVVCGMHYLLTHHTNHTLGGITDPDAV